MKPSSVSVFSVFRTALLALPLGLVPVAATAVLTLSYTGAAQAATINGISLDTNPNGWVQAATVGFTSDSFFFKTNGISNSVGHPWSATFTISSDAPLFGDTFLGCASIPGNACVPNAGLNVFTPGFGSSGDIAVINNTIEWSDPIGLTGVVDPTAEMANGGNPIGGLLAEINGNQLTIWDYCPSSCGTIPLDWDFQALQLATPEGPSAPEPATEVLFGLGLSAVALWRRRSATK